MTNHPKKKEEKQKGEGEKVWKKTQVSEVAQTLQIKHAVEKMSQDLITSFKKVRAETTGVTWRHGSHGWSCSGDEKKNNEVENKSGLDLNATQTKQIDEINKWCQMRFTWC